MNKLNNTFLKTVLLTFILSILHATIGEILFYITYYNDAIINHFNKVIYILVLVYAIPTILFFMTRYWYALLFLIILFPLNSFLFLSIFSGLFPLAEEDFGAGVLGIMILQTNLISVGFGTAIGALINLIRYSSRNLNT